MKKIKYLVYRNLTQADFFNINKNQGTEIKGGGQSYIDFPIDSISLEQWNIFFDCENIEKKQVMNGPQWKFEVNSIGLNIKQDLIIYQRRAQSISVSSQKISSSRENRVKAWHPDHSFPYPNDPDNRESLEDRLCIYIIRTSQDEFWAGWFKGNIPYENSLISNPLSELYLKTDYGDSGFINLDDVEVSFDETFAVSLISFDYESADANYIELNFEHIDYVDFELDLGRSHEKGTALSERVVKIRKRNIKLVKRLKKLYQNKCQISGYDLTFKKTDGTYYCEAHHLIPLGNDGSDSPENLVIVSPLIHKMLHYAEVKGLDLNKIDENNKLTFSINGEEFCIIWHPLHRNLITLESEE